MYEDIAARITRSPGRQRLFHFTRARNLPLIAALDCLLSSSSISQKETGERRIQPKHVDLELGAATINAHLRIAPQMFAVDTTPESFRAYLDRHVFFWPTLRDCRYMMATYTRREPGESFAVLAFDAEALMTRHACYVKLSKYDSGSSPRYPGRTGYRKSLGMFLPLGQFPGTAALAQPERPAEIREVLIERNVEHLSADLQAVYTDNREMLPEVWLKRQRAFAELNHP